MSKSTYRSKPHSFWIKNITGKGKRKHAKALCFMQVLNVSALARRPVCVRGRKVGEWIER